jgi:hypothetical protein
MNKNITLLKRIAMTALLTTALPIFAAAPYTRVSEVAPPDPINGQWFGRAVAINDDVAVVGAPVNFDWFNGRPPFDGAAYVYVKSNASWVLQQKLMASDANAETSGLGNQFGFAVAVAGNTIVVGAPSRRIGGKTGAVYVFERSDTATAWTEQAIITASTTRPLGMSVALRGGRVVAGALEDRQAFGAPADSGLAFVFQRSGDQWIEEANLITSDVPDRNRYGASVDIRGNTVVVGAHDMFGAVPGAVYVFTRQGSTWTQETKLSADNNSATFGVSVSLWGTSLAVGDWSASTVSIYERLSQNWQLQQTLAGASGSQFGAAVAQRGDRLLIGAPRTTVGGVVTGAAYLYGFDDATSTWTLNQTLEPSDGQTFDLYGTAVGLSGTAGIIGSPRHAHSGNLQSGGAYIYEP